MKGGEGGTDCQKNQFPGEGGRGGFLEIVKKQKVKKIGGNTNVNCVLFVGLWVGWWNTFFRPHCGSAELYIYPSYVR